MTIKLARLFIQHCYIGSIASGLSANRSECCRDLLDLAMLANEFLCPSLLMECELRLLTSKPYSCFCRCCCGVTRQSEHGANENPLICVDVEGPAFLITADTALDIVILSQQISGSPIQLEECYRLRKGRKSYMDMGTHYSSMDSRRRRSLRQQTVSHKRIFRMVEGSRIGVDDELSLSSSPFHVVKVVALRHIFLNYLGVLRSDAYFDFYQTAISSEVSAAPQCHDDFDVNMGQDFVAQVLLQACLDELAST
mmetsp:Transcript_11742/g.17717  ORF Transcript_11742/g.17717 Transcript_11742/m.17717 type:complete len:253 (-) Transcript_11742:229-987(-)